VLLEHRLGRRIPAAGLVISELVSNAMVHAGTNIDLSLAVAHDALRLSVRDPAAP
jgi:anti-sigma regulatory factor (Ser/Thr protein kinase)